MPSLRAGESSCKRKSLLLRIDEFRVDDQRALVLVPLCLPLLQRQAASKAHGLAGAVPINVLLQLEVIVAPVAAQQRPVVVPVDDVPLEDE